jgi:hypothetical protein
MLQFNLCFGICHRLFYIAGSSSIIIGTLYKDMKLKPNILDECAALALLRLRRRSSFSLATSVFRYAGRSSASKNLSGPLVSDRCPPPAMH